jgi:hypothetical protein
MGEAATAQGHGKSRIEGDGAIEVGDGAVVHAIVVALGMIDAAAVVEGLREVRMSPPSVAPQPWHDGGWAIGRTVHRGDAQRYSGMGAGANRGRAPTSSSR